VHDKLPKETASKESLRNEVILNVYYEKMKVLWSLKTKSGTFKIAQLGHFQRSHFDFSHLQTHHNSATKETQLLRLQHILKQTNQYHQLA